MIDTQRLARKAGAAGIPLGEAQLGLLGRYALLLAEWNEKINLTAITQAEDVEDKHFLDSLVLAARAEVRGSFVDVGSGAGFPGMVAAIYRPRLEVALMEPTGKRADFLRFAAGELGLRVRVIKERAEEAARKGLRETFDSAAARAVAALPALCEYCLPLVKPGGTFIAMKTDAAELAQAARAIPLLGGGPAKTAGYTLPGGARRCLVVIPKPAPTPAKYPRAGGVIAKRPIVGSL